MCCAVCSTSTTQSLWHTTHYVCVTAAIISKPSSLVHQQLLQCTCALIHSTCSHIQHLHNPTTGGTINVPLWFWSWINERHNQCVNYCIISPTRQRSLMTRFYIGQRSNSSSKDPTKEVTPYQGYHIWVKVCQICLKWDTFDNFLYQICSQSQNRRKFGLKKYRICSILEYSDSPAQHPATACSRREVESGMSDWANLCGLDWLQKW